MTYESLPQYDLVRDDDDVVRHLDHSRHPFTSEGAVTEGQAAMLAEAYLQEYAATYGITEPMLEGLDTPVAETPDAAGVELRSPRHQSAMGIITRQYPLTCMGLPVWETGISVTMAANPLRVLTSRSSLMFDVDAAAPDPIALTWAASLDASGLANMLNLGDDVPTINETTLRIYRYDPGLRFDPEIGHEHEETEGLIPTLSLDPVDGSIEPGSYYVVLEIFFTLTTEGRTLNWQAFVEVETQSVLRLRALVSGITTGRVFVRDPRRQGAPATVTPISSNATLNGYRTSVNIEGLAGPFGSPQVQTLDSIDNRFVKIIDTEVPTAAPPTQPSPFDFTYDVPTDGFAAINTYHHSDYTFRYVYNLIGGTDFHNALFNGTQFPVPVDHRGVQGVVNAVGRGNATGRGSGGYTFGVAQNGSTVCISADPAVVWHEFGHAILWDALHTANFGFSHSCGDSFGVIMSDPESLAPDRFASFPWLPTLANRRHDRSVNSWAFLRASDDKSYGTEQILSTTMFRIYRALGGDSSDPGRRLHARDFTMYFMVKAIATFGVTPTNRINSPYDFAAGLITADTLGGLWVNTTSVPLGAYHKVIRWGFEKQGLYQFPQRDREGEPPFVDVYIDDGRNGEYQYQSVWWTNQSIWNRRANDSGPSHQNPKAGVLNYIHVRVKNRGRNQAPNVRLRVYQNNPVAGSVWPGGWTLLGTKTIASVPSGGFVVDSITWTPANSFASNGCIVAIVDNIDDPANADSINGSIPDWRLIPHDNNMGQRNMYGIGGLGGSTMVLDHFNGTAFEVANSFGVAAGFRVSATLPAFMATRGWSVAFNNPQGGTFQLGAGGVANVVMSLIPGEPFSAAAIPPNDRTILITVYGTPENAEDVLPNFGGEVGGMAYVLEPTLSYPEE